MKTTAYTPQEEIKAVIILMVLTFAFLISKAQTDLPTQPTLESFTASITAPSNTLVGAETESDNENITAELTAELKSMMSSGSYWTTDDPADQTNDNLEQMLADWMKNGSYWEGNQKSETDVNNEAIAENEDE